MTNEKRACNQMCRWNDSSDGCIKPESRTCPMSNTEPDASGWGQVQVANEKRLIDANALEKVFRRGHYAVLNQVRDPIKAELARVALCWCEDKLSNAPTVDAVEVVRCKDCFYWTEHDGERFCSCWCGLHSDTAADDFCSYGERRK